MTHAQRFSTICLIMLGVTMFASMAWVIDRKEMGYKQSVIRAIQVKSEAQNMKVDVAFNPQKIAFDLYLPPLPARKIRP